MKIRENFVEPITVFVIKNDMGELLDHINTEIKKIKSDFIATFISNNSIRIYLFKKSILTLDYVYTSNSPYIIFTDYKGIKDVKNYNLPDDEEELVNYICNYLIDLNLTEREKIHI